MPIIMLTDDELVRIFHFVAPIGTRISEWKDMLPLLSVCSQWRNAALPLVYNRVFICCDNATKVKSNASLLSAQNIRFAKIVDISIDLQTPMPDLQPALEFLSKILPVWPGIEKLVLHFDHGTHGYVFYKSKISSFKSAIGQCVNSLAKLLPNIVDLELTGKLPVKESTWLLQKISKKYVKQIKKIKSEFPYAVAGQHYFTGLTHLDTGFTFGKIDSQINVCVDSLEKLVMRGMPEQFDWSGFSKHEHQSSISFPKLKALTTDDCVYNMHASRPYISLTTPKLHFPELGYLSLVPHGNHYPVLEHGTFDRVLDHLHLHATDTSLSNLTTINLPETNSISLDIYLRWYTPVVNVISMINIVTACAKSTRHIKLEISELMNMKVSYELHSNYITHLVIGTDINATELLNAIDGMPNLIELDIGSYMHNNSINGFCEESSGHVLPFNSKLRVLSFNYDPERCTLDDAVMFLKYMLLRLPNLKVVVAENISYRGMNEFVEQFDGSYPHLSEISFRFENNK